MTSSHSPRVPDAVLYAIAPVVFLLPYIIHFQAGPVSEPIIQLGLCLAVFQFLIPTLEKLIPAFTIQNALHLVLVGIVALSAPALLYSPLSTFFFISFILVAFASVGAFSLRHMNVSDPMRATDMKRGAALSSTMTVAVVFTSLFMFPEFDFWIFSAVAAALGISTWHIFRSWRGFTRKQHLLLILVALVGWGLAVTALRDGMLDGALAFGAFLPLVTTFIGLFENENSSTAELLLARPTTAMVCSFCMAIFVGTVLLGLPFSSASEGHVDVLDAIFTAVSAVCVTGLIVLDTPNDFSGFGQVVILLLIQFGGLGMMTFYAAALSFLRRRPDLRSERTLSSLSGQEERSELFSTVRLALLITFCAEVVGTLVLTFSFVYYGDTFSQALWRGLFTAVSAFCNAGFALQTDSLVPYQGDWSILSTVAVLIIAGGLSPVVVSEMLSWRRWQYKSLRTKIAVSSTAILLVVGFLLTLLFEWHFSLRDLSVPEKIINAFFHSATLRTAGFNSFDFGLLTDASVTAMLVFMFIGGCPGGTAGGIKTTTLIVLVAAVLSVLNSRSDVEVFGRTIPSDVVYRAATIAMLGVVSCILAILAIQLTQDLSFRMALFEVISALGTVGLSLGGTSRLDDLGKMIIVVCMFVGRVGPLTAFLIISSGSSHKKGRYPEERVVVG